MFNLFKKQKEKLINHQFKNLLISLPLHWKFEFEEDGQEACFDPKSKSTLRINIIKAIPPKDANSVEIIKSLTHNQSYITTSKGYLLTDSAYRESVESGYDITLITWRLINNSDYERIIAVLTYTVLTAEKELPEEKEIFELIEDSLQSAILS
jgi:hypothetical protein